GGYSSSTNAGTDWYSAKIVGPVAGDVFSWRQTITLHRVSFGRSPNTSWYQNVQVQFPCSKPTPWVYNKEWNAIGNWWLIQNVNGTYYATTMDWFPNTDFVNNWAPGVFWEHLSNGLLFGSKKKSTPGVAPMVYRKGEQYGLMVTTPARLKVRTTNERSNIVLFTMP
ncbi:MAG: hypothetical protein PHF70_09330, partial [Opitutales bacterium]|nr:hypothetical protein [Opitutales bacterium]